MSCRRRGASQIWESPPTCRSPPCNRLTRSLGLMCRSRAAMSPTLESHPARYFALLYSPPAQHAALEALFGIEREIFESLRPGMEHQVAHSRLQWWREECERTSRGHPVHPLTRALIEALPLPALGGLSGF